MEPKPNDQDVGASRLSLAQLYDLAASGDTTAIERILTDLEPELLRHIRVQLRGFRLKNRQGVDRNAETQSILHTVVMRFLNRLKDTEKKSLQPIENPLAYLKTALTHEILARAQHNDRFMNRNDFADLEAEEEPDLRLDLLTYESAELANAMSMAPLSEIERCVLAMIQQGMNHQQISVQLGVSEKVVRARKSSALSKLQSHLGLGGEQ